MIRTTILTLALGLALSASSLAQEGGKKKGEDAGKRGPSADVIKQFDKNGDGKLDEAERKAMREARAKKRGEAGEKGQKGKRGEAGQKGQKGKRGEGAKGKGGEAGDKGKRGQRDGSRRAELIKQFDKDGDGKLNEAERKAAREHVAKQRKERAGENGEGQRRRRGEGRGPGQRKGKKGGETPPAKKGGDEGGSDNA